MTHKVNYALLGDPKHNDSVVAVSGDQATYQRYSGNADAFLDVNTTVNTAKTNSNKGQQAMSEQTIASNTVTDSTEPSAATPPSAQATRVSSSSLGQSKSNPLYVVNPPNYLLNIVLFLAVCLVMKHFDDFVNEMLLSIVFAIVLRPFVNFLSHRLRFPFILSIIVILASFVGIMALLGGIINNTINQFNSNLATISVQFFQRLDNVVNAVTPLLQSLGIEVKGGWKFSDLIQYVDYNVISKVVNKVWWNLTGFLSSAVIIFLTIIFILIDVDSWQMRLNNIMSHRKNNLDGIYSMFRSVSTYIEKKFIISILTAVTVFIACAIFGVQFGLMWAVLTFGFNFIPNIGVFIVSAPMIVQVFILNSMPSAIGFTVTISVVHFITGNVIEPRYMSHHLNLSNTVVWVSLLFWNYILGPIGMLISIPLTTTIRILLSMSPNYKRIAEMMEGDIPHAKGNNSIDASATEAEDSSKEDPLTPTTSLTVNPHQYVKEHLAALRHARKLERERLRQERLTQQAQAQQEQQAQAQQAKAPKAPKAPNAAKHTKKAASKAAAKANKQTAKTSNKAKSKKKS